MSLFIHPYKAGSKSVKALSDELDAKRIKLRRSNFTGSKDKTVINWGCSQLPDEVNSCNVINSAESVALVANKLKFFKAINEYNEHCDYDEEVNIPSFTSNKQRALEWLAHGYTVVERHKLTGHSGEGIKIKQPGDALEDAPLYVMYLKKKSEWRVHVLRGQVVDVQRKARDRNVPNEQVDWLVRNHANGFIYARNDGSEAPHDVLEQAVRTVDIVGLDFGAVDVIYNEYAQEATVLEVNTAPGLTGATLEGYVKRFKELLGGDNG